jgi:hypothetical protein
MHLDRRHFVHPQQRIVVEVTLLHPTLRKGDLPIKRRGEAEHDTALHLGVDRIRVHHPTAIDGTHHTVNFDQPLTGDRNLGDLGHKTPERFVHGDATPVAFG